VRAGITALSAGPLVAAAQVGVYLNRLSDYLFVAARSVVRAALRLRLWPRRVGVGTFVVSKEEHAAGSCVALEALRPGRTHARAPAMHADDL
jgi:hypothetical protein